MKKALLTKLFILALIVAACAIAYQYVSREGFEGNDLSNFKGMVVFTKKDCPYCEAMADVNKKLEAKYPGKFKVVDTSDGADPFITELKTQYTVDKFPTILILKNGTVTEYESDRTEAAMSAAIDAA